MTHHLLDLTPEILEFGYYVKYKENVAKYWWKELFLPFTLP